MLDISVGLDLATSASIIGASIAYLMSERKRRSSERQWRLELTSQKQVELSHALVQDVLDFLPAIIATGRRIHVGVQGQQSSPPGGAASASPEGLARAIRDEIIQLRERIEFELLRPLEVKVDFVDGHEVWNREAAKCRGKLDRVEQAMQGLVKLCADPATSVTQQRQMLDQAVPFLLAAEPIGGKIDSVYTALIDLAKDLKDGLLVIQRA